MTERNEIPTPEDDEWIARALALQWVQTQNMSVTDIILVAIRRGRELAEAKP